VRTIRDDLRLVLDQEAAGVMGPHDPLRQGEREGIGFAWRALPGARAGPGTRETWPVGDGGVKY
jgi:hypothetical protein